MNRIRPPILGLTLLLAGLALGCQPTEETSYFTYHEELLPPGFFPGAPVSSYNNATDGVAFSPPLESVDSLDPDRCRYFPSGMGPGILLFQTVDASSRYHLYASYFTGGVDLMPAVELVCENQDLSQPVSLNQAQVAFLRSVGDPEGDALILVPRLDQDNPNVRLYYSYFDRTWWANPQAPSEGDVRFGFDTSLDPIDLSDTQDVHFAGFLTDGFRGSARFGAASASAYDQGEATTFALVLWSQEASASAPERMYFRTLDISQKTLSASAEVPLDTGAAPADRVVWSTTATEMNSYNNLLFFVRHEDATSDEFLLAAVYDQENKAFATASHLLKPATAPNPLTALPPCQVGGGRMYGSDEGLARTMGIFPATGYHQPSEVSLFAFQIDPGVFDATGFDPTAGEDLMEIDAGAGSSAAWSVDLAHTTWRLNRPGTCLNAVFIQDRSETTAVAALWTCAIRTYFLPTEHQPFTAHVTPTLRVDTDTGILPVESFLLPDDLHFRGFQGHTDRWTVAWKQDATGFDTIRWALVTVDMSPSPPLAPTVTATPGVNLLFLDGSLDLTKVTLLDGGTEAGSAYFYYVRNAKTGLYDSFRAYQYDTAQDIETNIGSLVVNPANTYQHREAIEIKVMASPPNHQVDENLSWRATGHHIFIQEYATGDSIGPTTWRHRIFRTGAEDPIQGDRFYPPAHGSASFKPPTELAAPISHDAQTIFFGILGDDVCVFFSQGGNLFYNQYDSAALSWYTLPTLVDSDGLGEGFGSTPVVFSQRYLEAPAGFRKALVFWTRTLPDGDTRLFARVRD